MGKNSFINRFKYHKLVKALIVLNFVLINASLAAEKTSNASIKIGVYELAPHVIIDGRSEGKSNAHGAVIDFINKEIVDKKVFQKVEIRVLPFGRVLEELAAGQLDMAVCLAKNPEREKKYKYFAIPFTKAQPAVILKKSDPINEVKKLSILSNKTLGHVAGSVTPDYLAENSIKIDTISGDNYHERNLARIRANRIDGYYLPTYSSGKYQLSKVDKSKEFKILKLPAEEIGLYFAFRKDYSDEEIKRLEKALPNIEKHYETFLQKYY